MGAWSEDEDKLLAEMSRAGATLPDMIAKIGRSRDSINGRLQRTGLSDVRARDQRSRAQFRAARLKAKATIAAAQGVPIVPAAVTPPAVVPITHEEIVIPLAERRTIATLQDGDCRWPIGDPQHEDFHFCGKAKVKGLPYCPHHSRRAFQQPQVETRTNVGRPIVLVEIPRETEDA